MWKDQLESNYGWLGERLLGHHRRWWEIVTFWICFEGRVDWICWWLGCRVRGKEMFRLTLRFLAWTTSLSVTGCQSLRWRTGGTNGGRRDQSAGGRGEGGQHVGCEVLVRLIARDVQVWGWIYESKTRERQVRVGNSDLGIISIV